MAGGGIVIVLGLVLGWRFGEKPKRPGQFDEQAKAALAGLGKADTTPLRFPVVLKQTQAYRTAMHKQMLGVTVVVVLVATMAVAVPAFLVGDLEKMLGNWKLVSGALIGIAVSCLSIVLVWRELSKALELRVTEHKLGCFKGGDLVCSAPLKEAYASTNALLLGAKVVRFRMPAMHTKVGAPMFDMEVFNRAVLARLPPQNLVSDQALAWLAIKNGPLVVKLLFCVLFVAGVVVGFYPMFR